MGKWTKKEREEAKEQLREWLPPGSKVYTVLRHVSRSGMARWIDLYLISGDGGKLWLTRLAAKALDWPFTERHEALRVDGCGMDMGFHAAHSLSYALHGMDSIGADAIEASEKGRPFTPTPEQYRAGYSLTQEWI